MNFTLNNGQTLPARGLGTAGLCGWQRDDEEVTDKILSAIEIGYRHIDTAPIYGNEHSTGRAISQTRVSRSDFFIATKLPAQTFGYNETLSCFHQSLDKLNLDYLDLYLIHWPHPRDNKENWKAMEHLVSEGLALGIGVCNFSATQLDVLGSTSDLTPVCNQTEVHPYFSQTEVRAYCTNHNIQIVSASPLGAAQWKSSDDYKSVLKDPLIQKLALTHQSTAAQVVLAWHNQNKLATISKSDNHQHLIDNYQFESVILSDAELNAVDSININQKQGATPEWAS